MSNDSCIGDPSLTGNAFDTALRSRFAEWPGCEAVMQAAHSLTMQGVDVEVIAVHGSERKAIAILAGVPIYESPLVVPGEMTMGRYEDVLVEAEEQIARAVAN